MTREHYVIRGGVQGRDRLRVMSGVLRPTTLSLLQKAGIKPGTRCLDVGCGGGDVAFELARLVGPMGVVVGTDLDDVALDLARQEAASRGFGQIEFRRSDIREENTRSSEFDTIYSRFLLTHLSSPDAVVNRFLELLRPGGMVIVEDIDFSGYFCHPRSDAFQRYVELYSEAVRRRGGDPNIGPKLPGLLMEAGFERVGMNVIQPAGIDGDVKLMTPLTMENVAEAIVAEGLATQAEVEQMTRELYEFARDPRTVLSLPRIVQVVGTRPVA